jgi:hypothetical protein
MVDAMLRPLVSVLGWVGFWVFCDAGAKVYPLYKDTLFGADDVFFALAAACVIVAWTLAGKRV